MQLREELSLVPSLAAWRAAEPENKYNLPSFSAYPQAYATAAGEYLMMLPQMLESLYASSGVDGDQQPGIDADWLDKVISLSLDKEHGAALNVRVQCLPTSLHLLPQLAVSGSQRLSIKRRYLIVLTSIRRQALPSSYSRHPPILKFAITGGSRSS